MKTSFSKRSGSAKTPTSVYPAKPELSLFKVGDRIRDKVGRECIIHDLDGSGYAIHFADEPDNGYNHIYLKPLEFKAEVIWEFMGILEGHFHTDDFILAGGAVRDLILGGPVEDYDIYINGGSSRIGTNYFEFMKLFEQAEEKEHKYKYADPHIDLVLAIKFKGLDIDLVFIDMDPLYYTREYFDLSCCKCGYAWSHKDWYISHLESDKRTKTFLYSKGQDDGGKHLDKVKKKYPDYRIIGA
jgi:hypothetical protein